ncbi:MULTISPECIES: hypothetical protein [unclassified Roseateles]|uniref:hypothetical protein n=1 Tax=unclassified Roseateles TaxID=2626991 RepID=UPI0006FFEECB|nr:MULTISPECIES: hypothetical protein [unclassified Roseateles]KQW45311.1 hypothetical protein ASC81_10260 [Pelomonas sp. Root405]KRA72156.1 hypothetical protein ASD88_10260 [Pelomonas sp. Root662]
MTKTERILAAYERFGVAIAEIPDRHAQTLHRVSSGAREFVAGARSLDPKSTTSQASAGLEQGLRETPELIQAIAPEWRSAVARAFYDALAHNYPEFLALESERLKRVLARAKIRSEAEYHRVRHEVDVVEGDPSRHGELNELYGLIDAFDSRA